MTTLEKILEPHDMATRQMVRILYQHLLRRGYTDLALLGSFNHMLNQPSIRTQDARMKKDRDTIISAAQSFTEPFSTADLNAKLGDRYRIQGLATRLAKTGWRKEKGLWIPQPRREPCT